MFNIKMTYSMQNVMSHSMFNIKTTYHIAKWNVASSVLQYLYCQESTGNYTGSGTILGNKAHYIFNVVFLMSSQTRLLMQD